LAEEIEALPEPLKKHAIDLSTLSDFVGKIKKGMTLEEISLFAALAEPPNIKQRSSLAWLQTAEQSWTISADDIKYTVELTEAGRYAFKRNDTWLAIEDQANIAFSWADAWLRSKHAKAVETLLEGAVAWRAEPATPAQIKLIKRFSKGQEVPKDLTKGQAGRYISSRKGSRIGA
jgi:hypothetical protein